MGANAVTTVPVYVAGEVLTAADLNITNSGIPVFAGTTERDAAFGGTGEKTLAEGQFAYLETGNVTQYYDGATWQTVGVNPGLVCVKAETAFSAVTSLTADSVFTSSYTNYRLVIRYQTSSSDELAMKLRAATVDTSTGYNFQRLQASSTTVDGVQNSSQTFAYVGGTGNGAFWCLTTLEINGVQLAEPTVYQAVCTRNNSGYTGPIVVNYFGNQSASTAFDGIKLQTASGTMTGSYAIYGYSKTV